MNEAISSSTNNMNIVSVHADFLTFILDTLQEALTINIIHKRIDYGALWQSISWLDGLLSNFEFQVFAEKLPQLQHVLL